MVLNMFVFEGLFLFRSRIIFLVKLMISVVGVRCVVLLVKVEVRLLVFFLLSLNSMFVVFVIRVRVKNCVEILVR